MLNYAQNKRLEITEMGYTTKYNSLEGHSYYDANFVAWWQGRIEEYRQGVVAAEGESDTAERNRLKRLFRGRVSQAERELAKGLEFRRTRNLD